LNNAKVLCAAITDALIQLDPDNAEQYRTNSSIYIGELRALHAEYEAAVSAASVRTLLFADRFPFLYLMNDYELSHYAAFSGCNAETEASFATMAFLIEKVNELGLTSILVTETSDQSIARTIARDSNENPQILVLDSLQSVTAEDVRNGVTYRSVMESNLDVLREALR
jgi:zinc transport system substrate-binding protein